MNEIKKYKRYAGFLDRLKSFLAGIGIIGFVAWLLFIINDSWYLYHEDWGLNWGIIDIINIVGGIIIFLILAVNLFYYFYKGRSLTYKIFRLLIINEKTGSRPSMYILWINFWYKFIFIFSLSLIAGIITFIGVYNSSGWDALGWIIIGGLVATTVFIIMIIINSVMIAKDSKKQSWYEKKSGVVVVKE